MSCEDNQIIRYCYFLHYCIEYDYTWREFCDNLLSAVTTRPSICDKKSKKKFSDIPVEVVLEILKFSDYKSLCTISMTNQNLKALSDREIFWNSLCLRQFGISRFELKQGENFCSKTIYMKMHNKFQFLRLRPEVKSHYVAPSYLFH